MIISTFNVQNDTKIYKKSKSHEISNYLINNKIDFLGLQEVFPKCNHDLKKLLSDYNIIGKYRFLIRPYGNEKNPIITKYKILDYKTYRLPFRPSKLKRVMTYIKTIIDGKEISIYNTHLEVGNKEVQKNQLAKIYEIISLDNNPKILMGDFNLKIGNPLFDEFILLLEKLNIKRIPILEKTFKASIDTKAIDHIFISSEFKITDSKVIHDLSVSDHYPVLVDIYIK